MPIEPKSKASEEDDYTGDIETETGTETIESDDDVGVEVDVESSPAEITAAEKAARKKADRERTPQADLTVCNTINEKAKQAGVDRQKRLEQATKKAVKAFEDKEAKDAAKAENS